MIRLNVFIEVDSANREVFIKEAKLLVEKSLNDAGCIAYDLFESCTRDNVLMICETWKDDASLAAHSAAPHFALHVGNMEKLGKLKLERFEF